MNRITKVAIAAALLFSVSSAIAEEARDLREGATGVQPTEPKIGVLPRFKSNPDTGIGTGVKIKAQNIFGTRLLFDFANIYTLNNYQTYEFLMMAPRIRENEDKWFYFMAVGIYDLVPDLRFFGVGNYTRNEMFDTGDLKVGDEASFDYESAQAWMVFGWHPGHNLYVGFEPFFRNVNLGSGEEDEIPDGTVVYANQPGTEGGMANGLGLTVVHSTANDQWRPTGGYRGEIRIQDAGPYMGSDYDFTRYLVDYRHYTQIGSKYRVVALRARVESLEGHNDDIPWWEMPAIGGRDTVRGLWENRFRGKTAALINAEFRYHIYHFHPEWKRFKPDFIIDGNLFWDGGQVFIDERDMNLDSKLRIRNGYGFGFRMTTPPNLMGRLDIGWSAEQNFATYFNFGTVF